MNNIYQATFFIVSSLLFTTPVFAIPNSDFDFYRAENNPTDFHATTYGNGLTGSNANAFQEFVNTDAQALDLSTINGRKLDSSKLTINQDQEVKIYFVNEGAHFRNKLAIQSVGVTSLSGFIFDDVSCLEVGCAYSETLGEYILYPDDVLELGDYVSVGNVESGSQLSFELITPDNTLSSDNSLNPSNKGVIAYEYEGYLILAWEDAHDSDFNDVIFAVDIGQENLNCIPTDGETPAPECNPNTNLFAD